MITVLFSPVIGSLIKTVALTDLFKSSLIMSSSRMISSSIFVSEVDSRIPLLFSVLQILFLSSTLAFRVLSVLVDFRGKSCEGFVVLV